MKSLRAHFNSNGYAKVSYRTKEQALAVLTTYINNPDHSVYRCPACRKWHIGRGGNAK